MVRHERAPTVTPADEEFAKLANELASRCPPSATAYSVGAVITCPDGEILATGYSRETGPNDHAEEAALAKARAAGRSLVGAHAYISLEPCGRRASKAKSCACLLIEAGIRKVYYTAREPPFLAVQDGLARLDEAGILCIEIAGFEDAFRQANLHHFEALPPAPARVDLD